MGSDLREEKDGVGGFRRGGQSNRRGYGNGTAVGEKGQVGGRGCAAAGKGGACSEEVGVGDCREDCRDHWPRATQR